MKVKKTGSQLKRNFYLFIYLFLALVEVNLNILKQNIQKLFLAHSNYSPRQQLNTSIE
jgi:hypothetical protein